MSNERLQKIIALNSSFSRRKAEELITAGRVTVNGTVITELGTKADVATDKIEIDGEPLVLVERKVTLAFNKPRKVVTTRSDPEGRPTVVEYLPDEFKDLKPVGRLDFDSEGLLLFTNDGELANHLTHPRYGVRKWYEVKVRGEVLPGIQKKLMMGIELEEGMGKFESVKEIDEGIYEVIVSEGRNRFVRRMFEAVEHPVIRLIRTRIGNVRLGELEEGFFRELTDEEVRGI